MQKLKNWLTGLNTNYIWTKRTILIIIATILFFTGFKFVSGFLAGFIFPGLLKSFGDFVERLRAQVKIYLEKDKL